MAKILTIDDDEAIREMIGLYLQSRGHEVLEAADGRAGIETCRRQPPDLVLCDLRMPGVDGLEVLAAVTSDLPEIPIIVVSGRGALGDAIEALKLGAWDYVTKPMEDLGVLEHAVGRALERARLLKENRDYRQHLEAVNAQLHESLIRLETDERAAREIQFRLLPEDNKLYGSYRFSRRLLPSAFLSGDFVDYFVIDRERIGFYIADVSGHGIPSALVTVLLKGCMSRYLELYLETGDPAILDPSDVLGRLNAEFLIGGLGKYFTMFYGVIELASNRLRYSNGGQFPFPILADETSRYIGRKGTPVGLFDFVEYRNETLDLPPRFSLALISDGILETLPQSDLCEKKDFLLSQVHGPELAIDGLIQALDLQEAGHRPDDVTVLLITKQA